MIRNLSRRNLVFSLGCNAVLPALGPALNFLNMSQSDTQPSATEKEQEMPVYDGFPTQPPELAREMVTVSHFSLAKVQELVDARPSLARAAWDWGFGDWEDALGAASHTGNRAIALYLIKKGARPTLFSAAMLGDLNTVKAFVQSQPGVESIRGPHSISLRAHAEAGGREARDVLAFLSGLAGSGSEREAPISETELKSLVGTYSIGIGPNESIEISIEVNPFSKMKEFMWTRKGSTGRPLYHVESRTFYPAGAPDVRISFVESGKGMRMTVNDPGVVLVGLRAGQ
ncbi:hypothetical protein RBB79_12400 [Tunturiibacter empetritectus]